MRILFTTLQRHGHFQPIVPIARAAANRGHEVAVACAASFTPVVERAGFQPFAAGLDERGRSPLELFPGYRSVPEHETAFWSIPRIHIAIYAAAMTPDLLTLAGEWHPDLIVRDAMEYGGCLAAEALDLPHASVRTGSTTSRYGLRHLFAAPLAQLREVNGLPPDPDIGMPFRYLHLEAEPPGFALPDETDPPTTHRLRPVRADNSSEEEAPPWVTALPSRPTIYASLGTVFSSFPSGQTIFAAILEALREEPINLIMTVETTTRHNSGRNRHMSISRATSHRACFCPTAIWSFITAVSTRSRGRSKQGCPWLSSRSAPISRITPTVALPWEWGQSSVRGSAVRK